MNIFVTVMVIISSLFLSGCNIRKEEEIINKEVSVSPTTTVKENNYVASDPVEIFLVELTKSTKLAFSNPVKSDMSWSEGESPSTLKRFFTFGFLINNANPKEEDEKIVETYFKENGFEYMEFNESKGEDSHRVGYRKGNLVCKYDISKYPDEEDNHLVVYCADASTAK